MNKHDFENARKRYPGICRGFDEEWKNFMYQCKKPKNRDWKLDVVCPLMEPAVKAQIAHRESRERNGEWCPQWKNFATWINGGWWTEVIPQDGKPKRRKCGTCSEPSTLSAIAYFDDGARTLYRCDNCKFPENVR